MSCGIYKITNTINDKCYIGLSKDIEERWKEHLYPSNWRDKPAKILYKAFKKYGVDAFEFEILEECTEGKLSEKEIEYIEKYNSFHNGYNMTEGGEGVNGYTHGFTRRCGDFVKKKHSSTKRYVVHEYRVYESISALRGWYGIKHRTIKQMEKYGIGEIDNFDEQNDDHMYQVLSSELSECKDMSDELDNMYFEKEIEIEKYKELSDLLEQKRDRLRSDIDMLDVSDNLLDHMEIEATSRMMMFDKDEYLFDECGGDWDLAYGM